MRLELKVTHTPNSKSKRPWDRWTWLGSKTGSVLLLAQNRIKVLYLQEKGSSFKKKVTKLSSLQNSALVTSTTRDGQYLLGYLESGDIFIWNKDQDTLRTVKGHPSIGAPTQQGSGHRTESIQLFASNDLRNILLVTGHKSIYLWEIDQPESALRSREVELKGTWSLIGGDKAPLPGADSAEAVSDAVFMNDHILGRSCVWSVVFYQGDDIQISTVLIRWFEPWHHGGIQRHPAFSVRWLSSKHSIRSLSPSSWPVNHHGALVASYNNSGCVLAIALNQRSPHEAKMAFVSPLTAAATVVDMKSCGCKARHPHADHVKTYWISDMTWTHNDLFLVCINKRGALAILPRLSEPILLQSEGCSVEHPPSYFLPVLNLITVLKPSSLGGDRPPSPTSSLTSESDDGRQRFSVSCHSSSPMILCSDGYLGLVMELPADLTCSSILGDYLSEGATALHLMYSARDLGPVGLGSLRREPASPHLQSAQQRTFSNMIDMLATADSVGLESTRSSEVGYNGPFGNMTSGKMIFDDTAMMASTQSLGFLPMGNHSIESLIQWTQTAALSAWGLGISHAGPWDNRLEYLMQYTIRVFMALFWILLRDDEDIKLPKQTRKSVSGTEDGAIDQKLGKVLSLYKAILSSSLWDSFGSHSMYSYLRLTRSLVKQLLKGRVCDQTSMTRCCIAVLHTSEQVLSRVYTRRPVSEPSYHLSQLSFHPSDTVEHALAGQRMHHLAILPPSSPSSSSSTKKRKQATRSERSRSRGEGSANSQRGKRRETRSETSSLPSPKKDLAPTQGQRAPLSQGGAVSRRMIPTWKRLYRHINKLLGSSTRAKGVSHFTRQQGELIQLLCYVQRKLHLQGYSVPLHLHSKWTRLSNTAYLKGCECYIKNLPAKAVRLWHLAIADPRPHQSRKKGTSGTHHPSTSSSHLPEDTKLQDETTASGDAEAEETSLRDQIIEASLLGILYTHLVEGDLQRALELADLLITCQNVGSVMAPERRPGRRLPDLPRKDMQKLPPASPTSTPIYVPYLANSCQQRAVQSLARFMALYFTNRPLYVFPPCSASLLPPLHVQSKTGIAERQIQITHEAVTTNVRQQDLSDKWTVNMTLNLLLVSGLVPEAVWLAHELGDWKSAFALSAVYSSQIQSRLRTKDSSLLDESLVLPPNLSPTNLLREGLNSVLQTPILDPQASPKPGKKVQRAGSFSGSQRRGSYGSLLLDPPATPIRKSSSVCSLVEEDKLAQVMVSQTLTDILTAATLSRQDPTHWLLESMMEECLILAKGFTSLVPEEFYLPAPPYYCPQPEYIPNDYDPPEVLEEDDRRREINDLVQLILLVLNASHCSMPCARWYVEQLREVQEKEKAWKPKESSVELPAQLQAHLSYPVDILSGLDDPNNNLDSNAKGSVLKCFRDLCCLLWMLYVRDKLSLAVRKYQTSKERSTHVQQTADPKEHEKTEKLLKPVLDWAECLYPFSRFLQLENEVNDILLTAIAELPLTKETVSILGRHFYDIRDLPLFLEDKFGRLREKLRRKKVPVDQRRNKKKEGNEVPDGGTTPVVFETLMAHYKRQSKKRMLERNNRKSSFRSLDDSVFELDDATEPRSRIASKGEDDSVFDSTAGSSAATPQKDDGNRLNSEEARLFQVGSREFEGNSAYLHFLETFFLVTFGKQVQEDAFMSQTELPLIRSFHKQVLDSEIKKNAGRAPQKSSLPVVKPSDLQFGQGLDVTIEQDEIKSVPSKIHGPGLFKKLFSGPLEKEQVMEIPRLPLQRSNSQTSLTGSVSDSPRGRRERQSSKSRNTVQLKRKKEDTCFTGITATDGFKPIRLNFGNEFQQLGKLVDWLSKWSGRQPSKGIQKVDNSAEESKVVMQVKLPQQLILISVWLLQQVYASDTLQVEERSRVLPSPKDEAIHGKVQFSFAGKRTSKKDSSALSGRHRHSGRRKRVSSISRRDKSKPSGREKDDHLPGEDVSPVDLSRPISVRNIPAIVIEKSGSSDNLVDSVVTAAALNANDNHPLLERPPSEVGSEFMDDHEATNGKVMTTEVKDTKKKRRQLPVVSDEKRRNSPNISQLLKGKIALPIKKKPKSKVKSVDKEEGKASKKQTRKKRSSSDPKMMNDVTEYEMTDLGSERNKTARRSDDIPEATDQGAPGYVDTADAVGKLHVDSGSNLLGISDDTLLSDPHPEVASNHSLTTESAGGVNMRRRSSVEILRRSPSGGGILSSEGHFYQSSSSTSSPDVSSLEDSTDDEGNPGPHPGTRTDETPREMKAEMK